MEFTLSPYLIEIGGSGIRYYSLMYLIGLGLTYLWLVRVAKFDREKVLDLCLYGFLAVVIGGRLGYALFYQPQWFSSDPLQILKIWQGGMSLHGGIIAVFLWMVYFIRKAGWDFLKVVDTVVVPAMFGIGLARIGNFMNGELWGYVTTAPWCFYFPGAGGCRHPSQLYEAFTYFTLSLILAYCWKQKPRKGVVSALFLISMGLARSLMEVFFREPTWVFWGITGGTWLSIPMMMIGLFLLFRVRRSTV